MPDASGFKSQVEGYAKARIRGEAAAPCWTTSGEFCHIADLAFTRGCSTPPSPNRLEVPFAALRPGEAYTSRTVFTFSTEP